MYFAIPPLPFAVCMLAGMLICFEIGRRIGIRWIANTPARRKPSFDTVEGLSFALFGLLIAFTFYGAPERSQARAQLIAEEANAIGTAYLRLGLLNSDSQPAMRQLFRDYLDARLLVYQKLPDIDAATAEYARAEKLSKEIWTEAVAAATRPGANPEATRLLLPALNAMIDITTTRKMAALIHPPHIIFWLLFLLALVCSLLAGFGIADHPRRSLLHLTAFSILPVLIVYVILEIEYPRMGVIPTQSYDQILVDLRESMR